MTAIVCAACATLGVLGCASVPRKTVLVVVDRSLSAIADTTVYRGALGMVLRTAHPGDRIILAPITDASLHDFSRVASFDFPRFHLLTDRTLEFKRRDKAVHTAIIACMDSLVGDDTRAPLTTIFQTLAVAEEVFANERGRKILVILSDMLEDSPGYKFESRDLSDAFAESDVQRRAKEHLVPNLQGVEVFVAGAGGGDERRCAQVRHYWERYFEASGARLREYARFLVTFE